MTNPIRPKNSPLADNDARLDELFLAYRDACPSPEPGANFMPAMWARIESRERSTNIFARLSKTFVTAALAASVLLGLVGVVQEINQPLDRTFIEAVADDHVAELEPFHLERISEMEYR